MAEKAIDSNKAKFSAEQFLKRLTDDYRFGHDVETMDDVVHGLLPRDDKGEVRFDDAARKEAAQTLIAGLDALNKKGDIPQAAKDAITKVFTDPALTTEKQLATQLKDQVRTQQLLLLLNNDTDFGFSYNDEQIRYIRELWNGLSPGLGDLLGGIMGARDHRSDMQAPTAHSELEQGFYAMFQGQNTLALFLDKERSGGQAFNVWNPPGNDQEREAFFSKGGMGDFEYQFYDTDALSYKRTFEDMILAKWEKTDENPNGIIKFGNSQAREHFIEFVKNQAMRGDELGAPFSSALMAKGQIEFASVEARAKFDGFTAGLKERSGYNQMSRYEIAEKIKAYVADQRNGVTFLDAKHHAFEDELNTTIWLYQDARTPSEFADKAKAFADWYPGNGIVMSDPLVQQVKTPKAMAGKPDDAPDATKTFTTAAANHVDGEPASATPADKMAGIKTAAAEITTPSVVPETPAATPPTPSSAVVQPAQG